MIAFALLAALDRLLPLALVRGTPAASAQSINAERERAFAAIVAVHFDELRSNVRRIVDAAYERWQEVPDRKDDDELRVVIVGNSAAMFALVPRILEDRLAAAFPSRRVAVIPLILPGIQVLDEEVLVRAALGKHADVVVLTPNLKGLVAGPSPLSGRVRELFGGAHDTNPSPTRLVDDLLTKYWRLYRERDALSARFVRTAVRASSGQNAAADTRDLQAAFAAIAASAARGDMRELVETYNRTGMRMLIGTPIFRQRLPAVSPVFATIGQLGAEVRQAHALGIAIFLPVNPIFRDATLTTGFDELHVDDAYIRALAARTVGIYDAAGFITFDRLDALPASGFIDLVHVNAEGMEAFSLEMAASVAAAVRRGLEGSVGRTLAEYQRLNRDTPRS